MVSDRATVSVSAVASGAGARRLCETDEVTGPVPMQHTERGADRILFMLYTEIG